jgi:hypothetical protein
MGCDGMCGRILSKPFTLMLSLSSKISRLLSRIIFIAARYALLSLMQEMYKTSSNILYFKINKGNNMKKTIISLSVLLILAFVIWHFVLPLIVSAVVFAAILAMKVLVVVGILFGMYKLLKKLA